MGLCSRIDAKRDPIANLISMNLPVPPTQNMASGPDRTATTARPSHSGAAYMHAASLDGALLSATWRDKAPWLLFALLAHAVLIAGFALLRTTPPQAPDIFSVSLLPMAPPAPEPPAPAPRPQPVAKKPQPKPEPKPLPKPAPVDSKTAISETQAAPTPAPAEAPSTSKASGADTPAPPAVAPVQYNAAYLNNPRPAYPSMSRRLGEEGKVMLEVQVQADGLPSKVSISKSSGYPRLDEAALDAVRRWKFVPAKRAGVPIAATVIIPMPFILEK